MRSTRLISRFAGLWALLVTALIALAAAARASGPAYQWPDVRDVGATRALSSPAYVANAQQPAIIWQPQNVDTSLVYQSLEKKSTATRILPYPDVMPARWQAAAAGPDQLHVIWLEQDGRLRSALIRTDGETVRGPIELADRGGRDFSSMPLSGGRLLVLWANDSAGQLAATIIDSAGRPGPTSTSLANRLERFAASMDHTGQLHVVWLTPSTPDAWTIHYQAADPATITLDAPIALHSLVLSPEDSLLAFALGLDRTHGTVIWSITNARQPDIERVFLLTFPLEEPAASQITELQLPETFAPATRISDSDLVIGRIDARIPPEGTTAALRWPNPAPGQHDILPLAVALRMVDGWHPAVIYMRDGRLFGFQIAAQRPADAGPSILGADMSGGLHLAWIGLRDAVPHLYTASSGVTTASPRADDTWLHITAGLVAGIPLGLVWLLLPTGLILLTSADFWTLPLALTLYGAAKLLWPPTLYMHVSPLLVRAGLGLASPGLAVGAAVLITGLVSSAGLIAIYRPGYPLWRPWAVFVALDMLLTWLVFGANVIG